MKLEQCCDETRGFVGGICDHCGGEVQHEFTHLELEQQVRELSFHNYKLEQDHDALLADLRRIEELRCSDLDDEGCFGAIGEITGKYQ